MRTELTRRMTESQLRSAIYNCNNGMCPVGGLPVEWYRHELIARGLSPYGYHEPGYRDDKAAEVTV